jgi:hypothetical protein
MLNQIAQSIAEPLLWNTLVIREGHQLLALETQLYESTYINGKHLGRMIRTLDIRFIGAKESISMIVLMTPRLHRYRVAGYHTGQHELITLSAMAAASLTHLEVTILSDVDGFFPIINSFVNLHTLDIDIDGQDWSHSSAHPLNTRSLKHLLWCSDSLDTKMIAFLARSSLAPDAQVRLILYDVSDTSATLLKPFFVRNSIREIELVMDPVIVSALMPEIMLCPEVIVNDCVPPFASQDIANMAFPRKLTVKNIEEEDLFWDALDTLVSLPPLVGKTMTLSISYTSKPDIDWLDLEADNADFVAKLLHYAVVLYRHGIIVIDKHGRDVSSLTKI